MSERNKNPKIFYKNCFYTNIGDLQPTLEIKGHLWKPGGNFMTQTNYTSKGNELTNPAVRLVVEENGKTLYEGWAFAKYPTMYAFEHDEFAFQLMDYIPADVS